MAYNQLVGSTDYSNQMTAKAIEVESTSANVEFIEVAPIVSGVRGREVLLHGDIEHGVRTHPRHPKLCS